MTLGVASGLLALYVPIHDIPSQWFTWLTMALVLGALLLVTVSLLYSARLSEKSVGQDENADDLGRMPRRGFTFLSLNAFGALCTFGVIRFFFPRILYEPKTSYTIGFPGDYGFGVSTKYKDAHRIWVVRDASGIFVIEAKCTHLGCTPDWKDSENKFKCPCHGSGFDPEGRNFEGPAPRPLERLHVELDPEGRILVDASRSYADPKTWEDNGAFISA